MKFAIYDLATGEIKRHIGCFPEFIDIQIGAGEEFFLNCPGDHTHVFDGESKRVEQDPSITLIFIRNHRRSLLSACDWTQLPDAKLTADQKAAWLEYRQALRDFPSVVDTANIVWPTAPC
jgi:hypothetical protein